MNDYCASVTCRHQSIVRYFGQELAAESCDACDVCLGQVDLVDDPITLGQKILSNVLRTEERFGADHNAKCLTGSTDKRIVQHGHDQLSTHGLLSDESLSTVRGWIEQLIEQGFLQRTGEYHTLSVTQRGRSLLRREIEPKLLRPPKQGSPRPSGRDDSWNGVDRGLFEHLRTLRGQLASQAGVTSDVIFSDVTLRDLARLRPSSVTGLSRVKGIGQKKREEFGETFVTAIGAYCRQHDVEQDVWGAAESVSQRTVTSPKASSSSGLQAMDLFRKQMSIEAVMQQTGRARSTVVGYLNDYLRLDRITDPSPWVEAGIADKVEQVLPETGIERLRPIFDALDGRIDYDSIRIVSTCWWNRQGEA
ncbi:MAG: RQC domain-containing protein [Pirellulaceae bacterium]